MMPPTRPWRLSSWKTTSSLESLNSGLTSPPRTPVSTRSAKLVPSNEMSGTDSQNLFEELTARKNSEVSTPAIGSRVCHEPVPSMSTIGPVTKESTAEPDAEASSTHSCGDQQIREDTSNDPTPRGQVRQRQRLSKQELDTFLAEIDGARAALQESEGQGEGEEATIGADKAKRPEDLSVLTKLLAELESRLRQEESDQLADSAFGKERADSQMSGLQDLSESRHSLLIEVANLEARKSNLLDDIAVLERKRATLWQSIGEDGKATQNSATYDTMGRGIVFQPPAASSPRAHGLFAYKGQNINMNSNNNNNSSNNNNNNSIHSSPPQQQHYYSSSSSNNAGSGTISAVRPLRAPATVVIDRRTRSCSPLLSARRYLQEDAVPNQHHHPLPWVSVRPVWSPPTMQRPALPEGTFSHPARLQQLPSRRGPLDQQYQQQQQQQQHQQQQQLPQQSRPQSHSPPRLRAVSPLNSVSSRPGAAVTSSLLPTSITVPPAAASVAKAVPTNPMAGATATSAATATHSVCDRHRTPVPSRVAVASPLVHTNEMQSGTAATTPTMTPTTAVTTARGRAFPPSDLTSPAVDAQQQQQLYRVMPSASQFPSTRHSIQAHPTSAQKINNGQLDRQPLFTTSTLSGHATQDFRSSASGATAPTPTSMSQIYPPAWATIPQGIDSAPGARYSALHQACGPPGPMTTVRPTASGRPSLPSSLRVAPQSLGGGGHLQLLSPPGFTFRSTAAAAAAAPPPPQKVATSVKVPPGVGAGLESKAPVPPMGGNRSEGSFVQPPMPVDPDDSELYI